MPDSPDYKPKPKGYYLRSRTTCPECNAVSYITTTAFQRHLREAHNKWWMTAMQVRMLAGRVWRDQERDKI